MSKLLRLALLVVTACSSRANIGDLPSDMDAAVGDEVMISTSDGGPCSTPLQCSFDWHSVIDCHGNFVQSCPPTQGCANGTCVPACDAAVANRSSVGCEYYAVSGLGINGQTCFAAFLANTWGSPIQFSVERAGKPITGIGYSAIGGGASITYAPLANDTIPAGGVGILFLSNDEFGSKSCPQGVNVGVSAGVSMEGTMINDVFHITTSAPVVAYDIFPYGGGSSAYASATLLLPTSSWDDNYVATAAWDIPMSASVEKPWIAIVADKDNTSVQINPTADIVGGTGVAPDMKGKVGTYTLNKGQMLRLMQHDSLSGSAIQASQPIGMWGGHGCTYLETGACDGMHQQIPPVKALGSEYVAVRYSNRTGAEESPPWRFVGAVSGTTLTYDPPHPSMPAALKYGQIEEIDDNGPFIVKSQDANHPFFFGAHMTGSSNYGGAGDPEFVDVVTPAQWLADYVFFTDPTYPETNLVFVRKLAADSTFHDVTLDCKGVLKGWQPVGGSGQYEYMRTNLVTGNFQKVGNCDNGRHEAKSDVPFGLTVWGWGSSASLPTITQYVSYAYPAGMSVHPINTVVVNPMNPN